MPRLIGLWWARTNFVGFVMRQLIWHFHCLLLAFSDSLFKEIMPQHDKTNKMTCAYSKDSDQPGHPPSLITGWSLSLKYFSGWKNNIVSKSTIWHMQSWISTWISLGIDQIYGKYHKNSFFSPNFGKFRAMKNNAGLENSGHLVTLWSEFTVRSLGS